MKKYIFSIIFLVVILLRFQEIGAAPLKIGWDEQNISSDLPVKVFGGFSLRVAAGTYDKLTVTALAIDNGLDSVIFLSCDTLNIHGDVIKEIMQLVRKNAPGCPVGKVIVNATHSHSSGGLNAAGRSGVPAGINVTTGGEYRKLFVTACARAIAGAWKKRAPGKVAWGYGYAVTGFSRRTIFADDLSRRPGYDDSSPVINGHGRMHGRTRDPLFSHYEAGMDPFANFLFTYDMKNKLTGALINVSTTAQCGNPDPGKLSADFWHEARMLLRQDHGNIYILPQCAAAGDIVPRLQHYRAAEKRRFKLKYGWETDDYIKAKRLEVAEQVRNAFNEVQEWASKDRRHTLPLIHSTVRLQLPLHRVSPALLAELKEKYEYYKNIPAGKNYKTPQEEMKMETFKRTRLGKLKRVININSPGTKERHATMELHAVRLGDIAFVNNPFELFIDYMHRIQGRSPFVQTFVIQLSAGEYGSLGYLPTRRAVANLGYSAEPFSHRVSVEGGDILVDETVRQLNMLWKSRQPANIAPAKKKSPPRKAAAAKAVKTEKKSKSGK